MREIKLLVATFNQGKVREIERLLTDPRLAVHLYSLADFHITGKAPERGTTFLENAAEKSVFYSKLAGDVYTAAEDSGLTVPGLGGAPGVLSARYAGPDATDHRNIDKLLRDLEHVADRRAKFVSAVSLSRDGRLIKSFTGEVAGEILYKRRGHQGFGYDPIFYYPPFQKTFAQLTTQEKNKISHRAHAFHQLKEYLLDKRE
jgi:XTP/dITP diphosphohydrolase